jgi:hypothetical protein
MPAILQALSAERPYRARHHLYYQYAIRIHGRIRYLFVHANVKSFGGEPSAMPSGAARSGGRLRDRSMRGEVVGRLHLAIGPTGSGSEVFFARPRRLPSHRAAPNARAAAHRSHVWDSVRVTGSLAIRHACFMGCEGCYHMVLLPTDPQHMERAGLTGLPSRVH